MAWEIISVLAAYLFIGYLIVVTIAVFNRAFCRDLGLVACAFFFWPLALIWIVILLISNFIQWSLKRMALRIRKGLGFYD